MSIFSNIMARLGYVPKQKGVVDTHPSTFHLAKLNINSRDLKDPYSQHAWVYACIRRIATNIAGLPLKLYTGDIDEPEQITSGPLYDVFQRPNNNWTRFHWLEAMVSYPQISGNSVVIMDRVRETQEPKAFHVFPRDRFEPILDNGELLGLKFRKQDSTYMNLTPEQFLIVRLFNPGNSFWGMGPLQAAMESVQQDHLASQFNRAFFENGANPGGAVIFKEGLSEPERTRYEEMLASKHSGADKAFKTFILEAEVDYKQYTIKHTDMCFQDQKKWNRDELCAVFGVPKAELSVYEDINYATARSADKSFWQKTLIPIVRQIEATFDAQFFQHYSKGQRNKVWMKFDLSVVEALQEDFKEKVDTATKLFSLGIPTNDIIQKLELGFEPVEGGDVGYLPIGLVPAGSDPYAALPEPEKAAPKLLEASFEVIDKALHTEEQERAWLNFVRSLSGPERRYLNKMRRYMARAKTWMVKQINKFNEPGEIVIDSLMLSEAWDKELIVGASQHYKQVGEAVAPIIETNLAKLGIDFQFNAADPALVEYLKGKTMKIVGVNDRMRSMVRDKVAAGAEANSTIQEIAGSVADAMGDTKARGLRIARTETSSAANGITERCHKEAGIKKHMWLAALDEVTRTSHLEAMALGGIPVGQIFGPTGCKYPGDETADPGEIINCRCDLIPTE